QQPSHLNSDEPPKRGACIKVWSPCLAELRTYFGETGHNDADCNPGNQHSERTKSAEQAPQIRGQTEDTTSYNGVNHQRGETPAANRADKIRLRAFRHSASLYHRRHFVSIQLAKILFRAIRCGKESVTRKLHSQPGTLRR